MSTWYGEGGGVDLTTRVKRRIEAILNELNRHHMCVVCKALFNPLEEMGERSCSIHPMSMNSSAISGSEYLGAHGSSRAEQQHYACCGTFAPPTNPEAVRDLVHEHIRYHDGCTRSDHISTSGWQSLIGMMATTHSVSFGYQTTLNVATRDARTWLRIYPLMFIQAIATLRRRQHTLVPPAEAVRQVMGSNALIFETEEQISAPLARDRIFQIQAGTRTFIFDVLEAYIDMVTQLNFPEEMITNRMRATQNNQQQQQQQLLFPPLPDNSLGGSPLGGIFRFDNIKEEPKQEEVVEIRLREEHFIPELYYKSQSLNKALSMIGMQSKAPVAGGGDAPTPTATKQQERPTAYQLLRTQLFGKSSSSAVKRLGADTSAREDLYTTESDVYLMETRRIKDTRINIPSGGRYDIAHFYMDQIKGALRPEESREAFFPFVVGTWLDVTQLPESQHMDVDKPCHYAYDFTRQGSLYNTNY